MADDVLPLPLLEMSGGRVALHKVEHYGDPAYLVTVGDVCVRLSAWEAAEVARSILRDVVLNVPEPEVS